MEKYIPEAEDVEFGPGTDSASMIAVKKTVLRSDTRVVARTK
jgi:hypothetical protein